MPPSLAELAQRREVIAQQIAQLGDLRPGCVTGTSGRCAKLSCRCHQPGEPAHGRHSNTVGRLVSNGEAMACLERLSPVSRMRRASRAIFCGLLPNLDNQAVYGGGNSFFCITLVRERPRAFDRFVSGTGLPRGR